MSLDTVYIICALIVFPPFLLACFRGKLGIAFLGLFADFMFMGLLLYEVKASLLWVFGAGLVIAGIIIYASMDDAID